jgi:hypothetical protein
MSAPEVPHSFPTVDAVNTPPPLHNHDLRTVVGHAQDQLMQLMRERQQIAQRIAILKRTIKGLVFLYGEQLLRAPNNGANQERRRGLTNACRLVLTRADTSLSAQDISAILKEEFSDLFRRPWNQYASLVTILNRLVEYAEADTFLRSGSRFWQRQQSVDRRSA